VQVLWQSVWKTKRSQGQPHLAQPFGLLWNKLMNYLYQIHMAIHTGEKGAKLAINFLSNALLIFSIRHFYIAYICPEAGCHRCFSVRSNMSRHIRNVHQIWPDGREEASDSSGDEAEEH
jgi:fatty-acid desaturase